ncbi:hypothetical protein CDAR_501572 [Caerostris darwini]|uniref:Activating signal cointegrator 1 complex subunit 2 n=1 Tax=Caerostris darwini TaxID=1538125 RepID=A0AAV4PTT5_9ARAC|nr:hypothetical protein CDAR_501572 [Caerostris darwini]
MASEDPYINIGFMEERNYVHFKPPPELTDDTGQDYSLAEEEEWLEMAWFLEEDLHWVLKLPYHRFWSQAIYDESLHKCLESYISQATRYYDLDNLCLKPEIMKAVKKIHKLVFLIYLRMSTCKESKNFFMKPEAFGDIIYDNYIFDVPKIMDLCVLYGLPNFQLMTKMIQNIFTTQPKYYEDLENTVNCVFEAFNIIEEKLSKNLQEMQGSSSLYQVNGVNVKIEFSLSSFHDVVNYNTDVIATLHAFLEIFSEACNVFFQSGAALRLATFYEMTFPSIEKEIGRRNKLNENEKILKEIKRKVSLSKTLLVKVFRKIIDFCCIQHIIFENSSDGSQKSYTNVYLERFLDIFMEITSYRSFLKDFNVLFPFENDTDLFNKKGLNLDPQRLSHIFCSIHDNEESIPQTFLTSTAHGARPKIRKKDASKNSVSSLREAADVFKEDNYIATNMSNGISSSETNGLTDIEKNPLVDSVAEILQECSKEFIEKCLQYFNNDGDRVIDAYVTDTLPDYLKNLNKTYDTEFKPEPETKPNCSVLEERKSVFDNDEFDVFRRDDINLENVHFGKKNKTPSKYENLSNDKESEFLKKYVLAYGSEETDFIDEPNLYEDEYDDTYDSAMVGLKEPVPEGEPDVDVPEETSESMRDTSKDFCENPEVIRERREQRREAKFAARGNHRGAASNDQTHNRQYKDRHKASSGNHNRRKQADFKKSRGMY